MKLLIADDDTELGALLYRGLKSIYRVTHVTDGTSALNTAASNDFGAIILDLNLPDMHGLAICREMRDEGITIPILVLTGDGNPINKAALLNAGADDYVTKPFHLEELKARLAVIQRRLSHTVVSSRLTIGELSLDTATQRVERSGQIIALRRKEFELLEYFMRHPDMILTREMIMNHVWDDSDNLCNWTNAIDVHIKHLRDKIDRPNSASLFRTIYGVGYRLDKASLNGMLGKEVT